MNKELIRKLLHVRDAMAAIGWDVLDKDRTEPSFESVCYVAVDFLSRRKLNRVSGQAASQITVLLDYLLKFSVRNCTATKSAMPSRENEKVYFCATSLFTCATVLTTGGYWNGVNDMLDGDQPIGISLEEWVEDSQYYWESVDDITLADIERSLREG